MAEIEKKYSVLVVEDEPVMRAMLCNRLTQEGYDIAIAENGKAAQHMMSIENFDLVLLDINMPVMNGYEVLEWARRSGRLETTKFLVVSASGNRDSIVTCLTAGAHDYLIKSVGKAEVLKRVKRFLRIRQMELEQPDCVTEKDLRGSRILIVDDEPVNRQLLKRHTTKNHYQTLETDNGIQVMSLIRSENIDLVLLDIQMPDLDGIEVLRKIREEYESHDVSVIMVTSVGSNEMMENAFNEGADDYICKPYYAAELLSRISATLKLKTLTCKQKHLEGLAELGEKFRSN